MAAFNSSKAWMERPDLSLFLDNYSALARSQNFIWRRLFRTVQTGLWAGTYDFGDSRDTMRRYPTARTFDGGFNRIQMQYGRRDYVCAENGLEYPVDKTWLLANAGRPYAQLGRYARLLQRAMELQMELTVADMLQSNDSWGDLASEHLINYSGSPWSDTTVDLVTWFLRQKTEFKKITGYKPTTLVVTDTVFDYIRANDSVKSLVTSEGSGSSALDINNAQIAKALGLQRIYIANSQVNNAIEGVQKDASDTRNPVRPIKPKMESVWNDNYCYLGADETGEGWESTSMGKYLNFYPTSVAGIRKPAVETYDEPKTKKLVLRVTDIGSIHDTGRELWVRYDGIWG